MKTRSAFVLLLVCVVGVVEASQLTIGVKTKLGVAKDVGVWKTAVNASDATPDDLLTYVAGRYAQDAALTLRLNTNVYVMIPWGLIRTATREESGHTILLTDDSTWKGRVMTVIETESGDAYDLRGSAFTVLKSYPVKRASGPPWRLVIPSVEGRTFEVANPRFAFQYTSSAGYIMGSATHETESPKFDLKVGGETEVGNLNDFTSVAYARVTNKKASTDKHVLTVRAANAEPVKGELALWGEDSKGKHEGWSPWYLVVDLMNGTSIAVRDVAWRLER